MSEEWAEAFATAQQAFPAIPKTKTVDTGSYSYKYADLPAIIEAVTPHLEAAGLSIAQSVVSQDSRVGVETRIYHTSGHVETFGPVFLPGGQDAKSAGSAITYARRYSLCAALGIATEDDDDGRAASQPPAQRETPRQDATTWLANSVQMFAKWDEEQRRETVTQVMKEQGITNPMSLEDAKQVFEKAKAIYYETHPASDAEAPF